MPSSNEKELARLFSAIADVFASAIVEEAKRQQDLPASSREKTLADLRKWSKELPAHWHNQPLIKSAIAHLEVAEAAAKKERDEIMTIFQAGCTHDGGFDRDLGPIGCTLEVEGKGGCVCLGIWSTIKQRERTT